MPRLIYIVLFLFIHSLGFSQEEKIKALEKKIAQTNNNVEKFKLGTELINEWIKIDAEKGKEIGLQYLNAAERQNNQYYIARFNNNVGSANLYLGNYDEARKHYYNAFNIAKKLKDNDLLGRISANLGMYYEFLSHADSSFNFYKESLAYFKITNDTNNICDSYNSLAIAFYYDNQFDSSNYYLYKAKKLYELTKNAEGIADVTFNLGNNFSANGEESKALESFTTADKLYDSLNLSAKLIETKINIAYVFFGLENYDRALELFNVALTMVTKQKNQLKIAKLHFSIANCFTETNQYDSAITHYNLALEGFSKLDNTHGLAITKGSMGILEYKKKNYSAAIELYKAALKLHLSIDNQDGIAFQYLNLAQVYYEIEQYVPAYDYAKQSFAIFKSLKFISNYSTILELLAKAAEKNNDYKNGFYYQKEYIQLSDSLNSIENKKLLAEMETQYNTREKDAKNKLLEQEGKLKDVALKASQEEEARINTLLYFSIGIIVIVLAFLVFAYRSNLARKKANTLLAQRNEYIIKQNENIKIQKEIIEEKQKEITDSINYAVRIQKSLLASDELLNKNLKDYFILFKPKDIVSGDFYWALEQDQHFHIMCADCTGHGVPGAFMSLLGVSYLNEITKERKITEPDQVLNLLREKIIYSLNQGQAEGNAKDGMDGVFCKLNFASNKLQIAAANNPVWILREENDAIKVIEIMPDKMPIGLYNEIRPFKLNEFQLQKNDSVFIFTDGFPDQFGGEKNKKLKYASFKELLIESFPLTMKEQQIKLNDFFYSWKGEMEQTDDVCVIGIKI